MSRKKFFSGNNTFLANLLKKIKSLQFHAQWKSDSLQNIAKRNCNLQIYSSHYFPISITNHSTGIFHNIFGSVNYGVGVFVWSCEKKNSFGTDWSKYDCLQSESVKKQSPKVTEICWVAKAKVQQKEYIVRVLNEPETEFLSLPSR